jgi:antitoxin MazE
MHVQISKWGNSLGLRLPRALAKQIGISEGGQVNIWADGSRLVVEAAPPKYVLEDLLVNMSPQNMSDAFSWGADEGREKIDE